MIEPADLPGIACKIGYNPPMALDAKLLEILACPACKTEVKLVGEQIVCQSPACGLRYPIRDGIPVMLIDEAEKP